MDGPKTSMNGPDEKTYILGDVANVKSHAATATGPQVASKLPEFHVPEQLENTDPPRLAIGAFPAAGDYDPKRDKNSLFLTNFNYINSIIGSGVLGMAYSVKQSGYGLGFILFVLIACASDYSGIILMKAAETVGATSYQDLMRETFGRAGYIVQSTLQFLHPFISLISLNIIVGDILTKVLIRLTGISPMSVLVRREFIITATTLLLTIPLSLYRNIARLAKVSLISVVIVISVGIAVVFRSFTMKDVVEPTEDAWTFAKLSFPSAIAVQAFAFLFHHSSFLVYDSLQDNTLQRWKKSTHTSVGAAFIIILTYAIGGYFTFTGYTQGDIFENYCWGDDLMNLCRGLYAITIILTYPIECFVCRDVLENVFFSEYQPQPFFRHAALTVSVSLIVFLLSLTTDCIGIVFQVNGFLAAVPLAYILPPLCYIRVTEGPLFCRSKFLSWLIIAVATFVAIYGLINLGLNYEELSTCSHGEEMEYCTSFYNSSLLTSAKT